MRPAQRVVGLALQFPDFDPVVVRVPPSTSVSLTLGPFAIRWYALAYIAGILLGWRYCVGLVRNPKLWGAAARRPRPSPQIDDLILWITLGVIVGGRLGYVLFYMLPSTPASGRRCSPIRWRSSSSGTAA